MHELRKLTHQLIALSKCARKLPSFLYIMHRLCLTFSVNVSRGSYLSNIYAAAAAAKDMAKPV